MKITYKDKEYEIKLSLRALMLYENFTQQSFNNGNLSSTINLLYAILLAASKNAPAIDYDEYLDWLDDNRDIFEKFTQWLIDEEKAQERKMPKEKSKKKQTKEDKDPN